MATTLLIGPPGSGKSTMAVATAVARPVHVLDLDRKLAVMENLRPHLEKDVTYWELESPLVEETPIQRMARLSKNEKPLKPPGGWIEFARMCERLETDEAAKAAGTIVVDSWTRVAEHAKRQIVYLDPKGASTMSERNYGTLLSLMEETTTILIDYCRSTKKDLIVTAHERAAELPIETTRILRTSEGREFIGTMAMKICPSVEGQFALKMPSYFEEAYALRVEVARDGQPEWKCRVLPTEVRDLRTSRPRRDKDGKLVLDFPPDFRVIWGPPS